HHTDATDDDEFENEEEDPDVDAEVGTATPWEKLESCVAEVISIAELALETARHELRPESEEDKLVVEEDWLQYIDQDRLEALAEEILEELEKRLRTATGEASWPAVYRIADTADKAEFFRRLKPFYQNHRKLFGTLVTPLVQGIRVRGRFALSSLEETKL